MTDHAPAIARVMNHANQIDLKDALAQAQFDHGDRLSPLQYNVWRIVCALIARHGKSPSTEAIIAASGPFSVDSVTRALDELHKCGFVALERSPPDRNGRLRQRLLVPLKRPNMPLVLDYTPTEHKIRPCMTCGNEFLSEGAHHRMCNACRTKSVY
jgi:DNA-binding MarR family transcriptional regulator